MADIIHQVTVPATVTATAIATVLLGVLEGRVIDRASRFAPTFLIAVYSNISDNGVSEIALRASRGAKREVRTPRYSY